MKSESMRFPEDFRRMLSLWKSIKKEFFEGRPYAVSRFEPGLQAAAWAWNPVIETISTSAVDRRKDMLVGPLFCSAQSPWPVDEFGPLIPLAQFDLEKISSINGEKFGDELLQLFCSQGDRLGERVETRTIAREIVLNDSMLEAPDFPADLKSFATGYWTSGREHDGKKLHGNTFQISGYDEKRFNLWLPCAITEEYSIESCRKGLQETIREFDEIYLRNKEAWDSGGFHLFGTFFPIQYYHEECGSVLFTFESEYGFNFGFDGQGQLFYEHDEEFGPFFHFRWACY